LQSTTQYDQAFYARQRDGSLQSARAIIPILLSHLSIHSVVDVGCGVGTWLKAFQENGISDITGYDGDYVDTSTLAISATNFKALDLCTDFVLPRKVDLAISLEVAEHLPSKNGDHLVQQLVSVAPMVLFSAAIPGQGGTGHVNEQWQDYWRSKFNSFGYYPVDAIRPFVWGYPDVEIWYQQNIILYCKEGHGPSGNGIRPTPPNLSLNIVHPGFYLELQQHGELYFSKALKALPSLAGKAISRRLSKP
jgi:SAM-dependent methyltransferase